MPQNTEEMTATVNLPLNKHDSALLLTVVMLGMDVLVEKEHDPTIVIVGKAVVALIGMEEIRSLFEKIQKARQALRDMPNGGEEDAESSDLPT